MKVILLAIFIISFIAVFLFVLLIFFGGTDLHFHKKTDRAAIRIACVGDSITNGALVGNCFYNSYPAKLGRMLGEGYHVENFGLNDRTLQSTGHKPYCKEKEYSASLAFHPDLVVILLGSNDTKSVNWISQEHFAEEYRNLINTYTHSGNPAHIVLCTPPWAMVPRNAMQKLTNDIDSAVLPEIAEIVLNIGREYNLPVIDLYPDFKYRRDLLSVDGLHPNAKGAELIAEEVYEIISFIQGKDNCSRRYLFDLMDT